MNHRYKVGEEESFIDSMSWFQNATTYTTWQYYFVTPYARHKGKKPSLTLRSFILPFIRVVTLSRNVSLESYNNITAKTKICQCIFNHKS